MTLVSIVKTLLVSFQILDFWALNIFLIIVLDGYIFVEIIVKERHIKWAAACQIFFHSGHTFVQKLTFKKIINCSHSEEKKPDVRWFEIFRLRYFWSFSKTFNFCNLFLFYYTNGWKVRSTYSSNQVRSSWVRIPCGTFL